MSHIGLLQRTSVTASTMFGLVTNLRTIQLRVVSDSASKYVDETSESRNGESPTTVKVRQ